MTQNSCLRRLALSLFVIASVVNGYSQQTGILRELYLGISGGTVAALTSSPRYPNNPDADFLESLFEAPSNFADNYGQRMRALITAPQTGAYTFWISSDDNSALYLSTDEDPAHKTQIAYVTTWTASREWTKEANQKSAAITLSAGKRYYIEALQAEGGGGDNLAVRWQLPSGAIEEPIPGSRMIPVGLSAPVITQQPTNFTTVEGSSAQFGVQLSRLLGATFVWRKNGVDVPDGTNQTLFLAPVPLTDSGAQFQCFITNAYGGTNTVIAQLTVNADVTKPTVTSVGNLGDPNIVTVIFSEPVEPATAAVASNYTIDRGVTVNAARMGQDARTVVLTTSALAPATVYTLTINNVRDRATTPNAIQANSQVTFNININPLTIDHLRPFPDPLGPSTRHSPLVISEIMYHPLPRTDGRNIEFVELYNSQAWPEDISGFRFSGAVDFTVPTNTLLKGQSYLVIAPNPEDIKAVYGITNVMGGFVSQLRNSSGSIRLHNRLDAVLLDVDYSDEAPWPVAADGAGHSLVLAHPTFGHSDPAAWAASEGVGGSPGKAETINTSFKSVMINEFLAHTDEPDLDFIELYNYSATPVDLSGCILTDDPTTNKFVIPNLRVIPAGGFMAFDQNELGFRLSAAGETIYLKNPAGSKVIDVVSFEAQENGVSMGRYPDGAQEFQRLSTKTKGASNTKPRVSDVVINEIMFDPISESDDDEYIELYNRSSQAVDIGKWKFTAGINYTFPLRTTIPANGYLVVAKNVAHLMTNYPNLDGSNALGDYTGSLGNSGERVALSMPDDLVSTNALNRLETNVIHIVVDEVIYRNSGRWGKWTGKGGSSLELIDSRADKNFASNWTDSDETGKSAWTTIEATGVLDNGNDVANSLQIIALRGGEYLVDNVEVIPSGGSNLVPNGDFENGIAGWVPQGNHVRTTLENSGGINNSKCLHVRATAHGDTGANRIRVTLTNGLNAGDTVTIRAKVRWLHGHPEILFRLHGNWHEATGATLTAHNLGTPGARNSAARDNAGPAITGVTHFPVLPNAGQAVTVVARVSDPDGLSSLLLKYRLDPSTNTAIVSMVNNGAGLYSATIPAQGAGVLAAFRIEATDNFSTPATTTFPNDAPARECLIRWGETTISGNLGTYRVWMTKATMDQWSSREHLSNEPLDITFVYNSQRIIYNAGGQYSGSPYHSPGFNSPIGNVCDYVLNFPDDDSFLGESGLSLSWPGNGGGDNTYQREDTAYWIGGEIGIPVAYRRHVFLMINGVRRAEVFEDVQQPNGDMTDEYFPDGKGGDLYKIQIWFEFDDPAVGFSGVGANLGNYTTTGGIKKLARYRWNWAKRAVNGSANNYTNLFNLVDVVNTSATGGAYTKTLLSNLDVQNWLRTYAVEHIVGNNDSYAYGGGQNMYTYKPLNDTWKLMIWDIDFAFQSQSADSDLFSVGGGGVGPNLTHPPFLRMYWQALQDAANGPLASAKYNAFLDPRYNALRAAGANVDPVDTIKSYMAGRQTYILNLLKTVAVPFKTTSNGGADFSTANNLVTLTGSAPVDVRTILVNGVELPVTWTTMTNWSINLAVTAASNPIVITGYDRKGAFLSGASNSFNITYTGVVEAPESKVVINEIMYNSPADNAGFLELYNSSTAMAFDLSGWQMSGIDFTFAPGTVLAPGAYGLLVKDLNAFTRAYGSPRNLLGEYSGKLKNEGETIQLLRPNGAGPATNVVDEVTFSSEAPWPAAANGGASSLQLIDASKDNNRVGNWQSVTADTVVTQKWVYATASGTASSSTLYMYLQAAGDVYIDDVKIVAGSVPEVGVNHVQNGDFESALTGPWTVSANHANSAISTTIKHSGNASLHLVATSPGTTQGSSVWQTMTAALTSGQPYTLSFWYLQSTNGNLMTLRLSGSGINKTVSILPDGFSVPIRYTPGAANSTVAPLAEFPTVWLNEILPNNTAGIMDRLGRRSPWLELFNGGTNAVSLNGLYLGNDYSNLTQWPFPATASIEPGKFATVWLDGHPEDTIDSEWHANFIVPGQTGVVSLARVQAGKTNIVDYLNYAVTNPNQSWGAYPDGTVANRRHFYYATPGVTNDGRPAPISVVVNEWMADNTATIAEPTDGKFDDWFELYNTGADVADLAGYYLTDTLTDKTQFAIPSGYVVPAHGRLLVWADGETLKNTGSGDLHVNFQLSKSGESIALISPEKVVIDNVVFGKQTNDISQGRFPDGGTTIFYMMNATPRLPNRLGADQNTAPTIASHADAVIWDSQLLNLTFTANDSDVPQQALFFSLDSAPNGAAINADTGLFSWRAPSVVTATTYAVAVRVTDSGVPNLSAMTTFNIIVAPYPQSTGAAISNDSISMTWSLYPGKRYQLQFSEGLETAVWINLGDVFTPATGAITLHDTVDMDRKFYRLVEAP
jgi:hypothetical protein